MSDAAAGGILQISNLSVSFAPAQGDLAVDEVSLEVPHGKRVGIVGESGSGKSTLAHAVLGLLEPPGRIVGGKILFDGRDLARATQGELQRLRGRRIAMVFQEALGSLNPVLTIRRQLVEAIRLHRDVPAREAEAEAIRLLSEVGVPDAEARIRQYPHEFSGGMRQRVMIAMALAGDPDVLIADEPTSALDVTTQAAVIALLRRLATERRMAVVLITHDLGVVAQFANDVLVMYAGVAVEYDSVDRVMTAPAHPYTRGLIASAPRIATPRQSRLPSIPGNLPEAASDVGGCRFRWRCYLHRGREACVIDRPAPAVSPGAEVACHFAEEVEGPGDPLAALSATGGGRSQERTGFARVSNATGPVMALEAVTKTYRARRRRRGEIRAVDGASLTVNSGEAVGLVGESGSGKTTLARIILGLTAPDSGVVRVCGVQQRWSRLGHVRGRTRGVQAVFQDPADSLDPTMTVNAIVAEPLRLSPRSWPVDVRVREVLDLVGLSVEQTARHPLELSGGQRQRVAIARALAPEPDLIVLDEAVSSLDVSIRAQILNLLIDLRERLSIAYLFITHDLSVVRHVCDRGYVLHRGVVVEEAAVDDLFTRPQHAYTASLLAAVPSLEPPPEPQATQVDRAAP